MRLKTQTGLIALSLLSVLITVTLALAQGNGHGNGNGNKPTNKIIHLQPGSVEPMATGIAKIFFKTNGNAMERFQVVGANLKASTAYTLFVDGTPIATKTAEAENDDDMNSGAAVEFMFSKKAKGGGPNGNNLPTSLDPVTKIKHVELQDPNKAVVLSGDFS